jgi:hypothetical protein
MFLFTVIFSDTFMADGVIPGVSRTLNGLYADFGVATILRGVTNGF